MKHAPLIFAALLSACALQTKHRGFVFPHDLDSQAAAVKTVKDLEDRFGSPQAETIFGDRILMYYGADENYRGPLKPTYDNKTALLAWADRGGKITKTKNPAGRRLSECLDQP